MDVGLGRHPQKVGYYSHARKGLWQPVLLMGLSNDTTVSCVTVSKIGYYGSLQIQLQLTSTHTVQKHCMSDKPLFCVGLHTSCSSLRVMCDVTQDIICLERRDPVR